MLCNRVIIPSFLLSALSDRENPLTPDELMVYTYLMHSRGIFSYKIENIMSRDRAFAALDKLEKRRAIIRKENEDGRVTFNIMQDWYCVDNRGMAAAVSNGDLSLSAIGLAAVFNYFDNNSCGIKLADVANRRGVDMRTVRSAAEELIEWGYISGGEYHE